MSLKKEVIARNSIKKEFNKVFKGFSLDFHEQVAFYTDSCTEEYYEWRFELPYDFRVHQWRYYYDSKIIEKTTTLNMDRSLDVWVKQSLTNYLENNDIQLSEKDFRMVSKSVLTTIYNDIDYYIGDAVYPMQIKNSN